MNDIFIFVIKLFVIGFEVTHVCRCTYMYIRCGGSLIKPNSEEEEEEEEEEEAKTKVLIMIMMSVYR